MSFLNPASLIFNDRLSLAACYLAMWRSAGNVIVPRASLKPEQFDTVLMRRVRVGRPLREAVRGEHRHPEKDHQEEDQSVSS